MIKLLNVLLLGYLILGSNAEQDFNKSSKPYLGQSVVFHPIPPDLPGFNQLLLGLLDVLPGLDDSLLDALVENLVVLELAPVHGLDQLVLGVRPFALI